MEYTIIGDSCCDVTPELIDKLGVKLVPLTIRLGEKEFVDDEELDMDMFITEMRENTGKSGTAAPSPLFYQEAIEAAVNSFVVTLSSSLSGSYQSAVIGMKNAIAGGKARSYVFDSKSAAAAEVLIAVKIREMLQNGIPVENIIHNINSFIESMKTYFVLERYDNLMKNGRMNKVAGRIISVLNIKLLMGADENGEIAMYGTARGVGKMIDKMMGFIKDSGKKTEGESIVISHCNNPGLAERFRSAIEGQFNFKEILIVPTRGISSFYADEKGIIMAF